MFIASAQRCRGGYSKYTNRTAITDPSGVCNVPSPELASSPSMTGAWLLLAGAICCVRQRGRHQPVSSCQGLARPNARDLGLASTRLSAAAESGLPISSRCWLTIPAPAPDTAYPSRLLSLVFAICHCRHRPLHCIVQCAPVGRCDRRRGHRRRCRGDALYRHGGTRASGAHCVGARYRFGLGRVRQRIRGDCACLSPCVGRCRSYRGRRRPADSRNRFTSFHGDGRRHARSRSDARLPTG